VVVVVLISSCVVVLVMVTACEARLVIVIGLYGPRLAHVSVLVLVKYCGRGSRWSCRRLCLSVRFLTHTTNAKLKNAHTNANADNYNVTRDHNTSLILGPRRGLILVQIMYLLPLT
jgi:hypothetical protein